MNTNPSMRRQAEADDEERRATLDEEFFATIEEARMVLPGLQTLFGFQLIAVFSETFRRLPALSVDLHVTSLLLIALSVALIMTPAAYHRIAERGCISRSFCTLASHLIAAAMVVMSIGLCLEIYVVVHASTDNAHASLALAMVALLVFAAFWLIYPLLARSAQRKRARRRP